MVTRPGPLALAGSGEFLPVMHDADRFLIDQVGGPAEARVAVIPTASGLEPGMPEKWARLGIDHYRGLGVRVEPVMIVERADTTADAWLAILELSNFFYFSGGSPQHVIETYRDTPAWEIIRARHEAGAVLAGCSAGAMMLGGATIRVRDVAAGRPPVWVSALGLAPRLATIPHFDRLARYVGDDVFTRVIDACPPDLTLLGIDEDTVLVRVQPPPVPGQPPPAAEARWRVWGSGSVTVFRARGLAGAEVFPTGSSIDLDEGRPANRRPEKDASIR